MRELAATGFMSNRGRQNVCSFLAIDMNTDWRYGADYFESELLDYDVYSNWGNWCAGAGMTGGRLNRFNIVKQSKDYDQHGEYVKHWIPELKNVPTQYVHEPWKLSNEQQTDFGVRLGVDYPNPLVPPSKTPHRTDHKQYNNKKKRNNNNNNNNEDRRQILANHYDSMMNSKYFQQQEEDLDMPQLHRLIQDEEEGEGDGDKDGEGEGNDKDGESGSSDGSNEDEDEEEEEEDNQYIQLLRTRSTSMAFVVLYTTAWALALSMYGTTAIVGFTSISGVYIGPCFSQGDMKVGMFGGALVVFANLLLVCAVIFGEFRVSDNRDGHDNDEMEPYAVEQIASVLAITCMFLCILYILFALMLFIFHPSLAPGGKGATEVDPASIELVGDNKWRTSSGTFMNQRYA
mmetsp:Transcript_15137/g.23033  ORF Transcript_15137/g.23033 Transcript_15137/m.23033 type:complete len:402 (+) Transcript_15137:3-1208(+)